MKRKEQEEMHAVLSASEHNTMSGPLSAPMGLNEQSLTSREAEILTGISKGMTDKEIARNLGISPHTVSNHVRNISRKAGGGRRSALVAVLVGLVRGTPAD